MSLYSIGTYKDSSNKSLAEIEKTGHVVNKFSFFISGGSQPITHTFVFVVSKSRGITAYKEVLEQTKNAESEPFTRWIEHRKKAIKMQKNITRVYIPIRERKILEIIERQLKQAEYAQSLFDSCFRKWKS